MVVVSRLLGPLPHHGHCIDLGNGSAKPVSETRGFLAAWILFIGLALLGIAFFLPEFVLRGQEEVLIPIGLLALSIIVNGVFVARLLQIRTRAARLP